MAQLFLRRRLIAVPSGADLLSSQPLSTGNAAVALSAITAQADREHHTALGSQHERSVLAQLKVPKEFNPPRWFDHLNTAWWFAALLRLRATPLISVPVIASEPFSKAPEIEHDIQFWPIEAEPRRLILDRAPATRVSESVLVWVGDHWREGGVLMQAFDQSLFARSVKLALLSLWGALEAVFSPGRNELRFRVTALIATFLEPAGENRRSLQRKLEKLYDSRSAAAHGRPESLLEPLIETYAITKCIVTKILEENRVPTPLQLENQLFGIHSG